MSNYNILKSLSVVTLGAVIGYSSVRGLMAKNSPNRYLASATMSKMAVEQTSKSILDIQVKKSIIGLTDADSSTIEVSIEALQPIPAGVPFDWNLPEGVTVIKGASHGLLPEFTANQVQDFTLQVSGFNKSKKTYISFSVKGDMGSIKLQQEVLFSTRPEDSFEYVVQTFERKKTEDSKASGKVSQTRLYKGPIDPKKIVH